MEYIVSRYYCCACDTYNCFTPNNSPNTILLDFINNSNWWEGKF